MERPSIARWGGWIQVGKVSSELFLPLQNQKNLNRPRSDPKWKLHMLERGIY
jgi:hypothetical protein